MNLHEQHAAEVCSGHVMAAGSHSRRCCTYNTARAFQFSMSLHRLLTALFGEGRSVSSGRLGVQVLGVIKLKSKATLGPS